MFQESEGNGAFQVVKEEGCVRKWYDGCRSSPKGGQMLIKMASKGGSSEDVFPNRQK